MNHTVVFCLLCLSFMYNFISVNSKQLRADGCISSNKTMATIGCMLCTTQMKSASKIEKRRMLTKVNDKFEEIYSKEAWGTEGGGSGVGSNPDSAYHTGYLVELLMYKYGLTSLLDAPCGAVHSSWTRDFITRMRRIVPCFRYHGIDAALSVITKNKEAFEPNKWATFSHMDLSETSDLSNTPRSYDVILSRDALQHLPYHTIAGVFLQYCATESTYLLLGSYLDVETGKNKDIPIGDAFCINVRLPPFSFPKPVEVIREAIAVESRKYLLLYKLETLCADPNLLNFIKTYSSDSQKPKS